MDNKFKQILKSERFPTKHLKMVEISLQYVDNFQQNFLKQAIKEYGFTRELLLYCAWTNNIKAADLIYELDWWHGYVHEMISYAHKRDHVDMCLESIEEDNDRKYWASKIVRISFYMDRLSVIKRINDMGLLYSEELNLPWIDEHHLFKMDIIQYLASRGAKFEIADKEIEQALIDEPP